MAYPQNNGKPIFQEFITSIGRMVHLYHDKPQLKTKDEYGKVPDIDENGNQIAEFKVTLAWPKSEMDTALIPLRQLAATVRDEAWPGQAAGGFFALQPFLRDGDNPEHNTKNRDYLRGHVYLNFKQKAAASKGPDGKTVYGGAPGLIGPRNEDIMPVDLWTGCYGRVSGIMFGTEYMGKNFISTRLNNIQKGGGPNGDGSGERLGGGGRPDAKSQFDPLLSGGAVDPFAGFGGGTKLIV